jgi:outer membrane usher protein FimD/PapC
VSARRHPPNPIALQTYSGAALLGSWLLASQTFAASPSTSEMSGLFASGPQEVVLEVALGEHGKGESLVVLRGADDAIYLDAAEFAQLRLRLPKSGALLHEGRPYYAAASIPGAKVALNEALQRVIIEAPPEAFELTRLSAAERQSPPVTPASPGAFLNYQLSSQQIDGRNNSGAYAEMGAFAAMGVVTSTAVARDSPLQRGVVRLDTS